MNDEPRMLELLDIIATRLDRLDLNLSILVAVQRRVEETLKEIKRTFPRRLK